jgi:predicted metal-dependent enzyme (double-stranded beta helix superfamily)
MTIRTRGTLPVCAATLVMTLAGASLSIQHSYGAQAVAVDRASRDYTLPDQMQWRATEDGTTSSLYGDPSKPGLYAYIVKRGPNAWSKPHFHDNDRFVTVLEGTLWVGTGKLDPQRTVPLKAGSFVRDVAGGIHFEGTKDDGATLYFIGIGPTPSHPAEASTTTTTGSGAGVIDPAVRQVQRVEDMPKESFVLYGDSSKPGLYVQYQRRAPNNWSSPHYHSIDRVVMVLGGTMWIGTEPSGDRARTVAVPKGGFIRDIAQGIHYDGSGNDPLWIQIAGVGPTATTNVDPPK